jgi:hypothetical protein
LSPQADPTLGTRVISASVAHQTSKQAAWVPESVGSPAQKGACMLKRMSGLYHTFVTQIFKSRSTNLRSSQFEGPAPPLVLSLA